MERILRIHPTDNLIVALQNLPASTEVLSGVTLGEDIPAKHKFAALPLRPGDVATMYGVPVGKANKDIPQGGRITTENLAHFADAPTVRYVERGIWQAPPLPTDLPEGFMGIARPDGQVGSANYWVFLSTVFCENRNMAVLQEAFTSALGYGTHSHLEATIRAQVGGGTVVDNTPKRAFEHIDGVQFLTHEGGCGTTRQSSEMLAGLLANYVAHPNVAGATILSLGCEHIQTDTLDKVLAALPDGNAAKPVLRYNQQLEGLDTDKLLERIALDTLAALKTADVVIRSLQPLAGITLGVKCGGSDGFSGISANPALGYAADLLVALGGKVVMAEFPELNGVEQELADRCVTPELAQKFLTLMERYGRQAEEAGSGFHMNPSPGNIRDGLITDAMKSAGAARKGGTSPVVDVLNYTERATKPGLSLLCSPGNDVEATTALAAAGCNVIVFTTGLGTPTGNAVCPVLKVSSNSTLPKRLPDLIDYDCGGIIDGSKTVQQVGVELLRLIIETASGTYIPAAVKLKQFDFIPWRSPVSL